MIDYHFIEENINKKIIWEKESTKHEKTKCS